MSILICDEDEKKLRKLLAEMDKIHSESGLDSFFEGQRDVLVAITSRSQTLDIDQLVSEWDDV